MVFGFIFGLLLQRGLVANYDVIGNQFRLKDFTDRKWGVVHLRGGPGELRRILIADTSTHLAPRPCYMPPTGAIDMLRMVFTPFIPSSPQHWQTR